MSLVDMSKRLEKSLQRGPIGPDRTAEMLTRETLAREESDRKYGAEHDLRLQAEHGKHLAEEILNVERNRLTAEVRRLEAALAQECAAHADAERRIVDAQGANDRTISKAHERDQDSQRQIKVLTAEATAAKVTAAALEAELSAVQASITQERAYAQTERQTRLSLENRLREAMLMLSQRSDPPKIEPPSYELEVVAHDSSDRIRKIRLTPKEPPA